MSTLGVTLSMTTHGLKTVLTRLSRSWPTLTTLLSMSRTTRSTSSSRTTQHIGIDKREHLAEWDPIVARVAKFNAEAAEKKEAEKKQREMDAEKRRIEQEAKEK